MRASTRGLACLTLVFSLCTQGVVATRAVRAQSLTPLVQAPADLLNLKLSPDLLDLVLGALAGARVHVIVQSAGPWGAALDTLLLLNGARVTRAYQGLDMRAVDLPALNVLNLAVAPGIKFISPDRETRQFGHLSLTTGADAARSQSTSASLDGAGVGIAVLDSG
ncbi:MAG TPA: hypothetical protein VE360_00385, partial [Pyrinomonadaceae bacterium]|nr:hypothetical protein [Pyrinomonadaceae bacterium]